MKNIYFRSFIKLSLDSVEKGMSEQNSTCPEENFGLKRNIDMFTPISQKCRNNKGDGADTVMTSNTAKTQERQER